MCCDVGLGLRSMYTLLDVESNTECGTTDPGHLPRNVFPGYREVNTRQIHPEYSLNTG